MESGGLKKTSAKLAAPTKCSLKQPTRGKLSAILYKRMIDEAKQAQTREKGSNINQGATTASSNPKPTNASSKPKDIAHDAGATVSPRQAECRTNKEDTGAASEKSVFASSSDHESRDSQGATAFSQPTKKPDPAFKVSTLRNRIKEYQDSAVSARVPPSNVTDSHNVKLRTDTETTCAPVDNATTQAEPDSHELPIAAEASDARPLMPQHKASELKARDSTEAGFVLSIPSFDSMETKNECDDINSLIQFLDDDAKIDYNPMFGTLNKAGQSRSHQLLPCDPMDLEPSMDTLPIEEHVKVPGCGLNGMSQPELNELGTASEAAFAGQLMPTANSEKEVHVTVLAEMGLQSSRRAEQPNKVSLGATDAETSSKVSTPAYKPPSISRVEPAESRNSEDTPAGVQNKSGSPETGMCEQAKKVKGAAVTTNKENHKPSSAFPQSEGSAKKGKTASKANSAPHNEMVPPKAPPTKKPAFKVPTREVTSKTEVRISKTAALLNGTQPRANASNSAETKLQASLASLNPKASSSTVIEAAPKARTADNNGTRSMAGAGKAAEVNVQAVPSRINGVQSKAIVSMAADKNTQAVPENTDETQPKPGNGYVVDSEDSDFESLSNTQDLTFEDTLSSISQSLDISQDSDFASLDGIDGSQSFDMEE
uniref:Transcription regulatory protein n=1 Tax=Rhipicephalus appendiculatus TaxID=34631 RepID=A0A131Z266_RHIAP